MRPVVQTQTATYNVSTTPITRLDHYKNPFNVTVGVVLIGTLGSGAATVQFTLDDPDSFADVSAMNANATWFNHATLAQVSANNVGNIAFPVRAVRTYVSAITSGYIQTTIIQSGSSQN